jgi:hypothetical protein
VECAASSGATRKRRQKRTRRAQHRLAGVEALHGIGLGLQPHCDLARRHLAASTVCSKRSAGCSWKNSVQADWLFALPTVANDR